MKSKTLSWSRDTDIHAVASLLQQGHVVAGSSDTVVGLFAPVSQKGFDQLNFIKKRSEKPYIIIIPFREKVFDYAQSPQSFQVEKIITHCWPGPLTIIVKAKKGLPPYLTTEQGTISLRVPKHAGLQKLLSYTGALFSTSANPTGEPVPCLVHDIDDTLIPHIAAFINDGDEPLCGAPSTIVDCSGPSITIVREGAFPTEDLEKVLKS